MSYFKHNLLCTISIAKGYWISNGRSDIAVSAQSQCVTSPPHCTLTMWVGSQGIGFEMDHRKYSLKTMLSIGYQIKEPLRGALDQAPAGSRD